MQIETVVNWSHLKSLKIPLREGCAWVDDASIHHCLKTGLLEDARHPQNEYSHHAARIAWLTKRFQSQVNVDRIHLHVVKEKISIYDGAHRLRALQYLGHHNIRVRITGDPRSVKKLMKAYNDGFNGQRTASKASLSG